MKGNSWDHGCVKPDVLPCGGWGSATGGFVHHEMQGCAERLQSELGCACETEALCVPVGA